MRAALVVGCLAACGRIDFDPQPAVPPAGDLAISVASFETTNNAFTQIPGATMVLPPSEQRWLVVTTATLQSSSFLEVAAEVRYTVDGVERGIGGTQSTLADRAGPFQHFVVLDASAAEQTLAFELRDASAGTARIEQLRAYAVPLVDDAFYKAVDPPAEVTSTTPVPMVTFVPEVPPGEYLFFGLANVSEGTGNDCYTEWLAASGMSIDGEMQMPRQSLQSHLVIWRETIGMGASIILQARVGTSTGELRYVRLLAIPTASVASAYSERTVTVGTTTEELVNDLTPSFEADRYLWIASARVEPDCMNVPDPPPDIQVVFGGTGVTPSTIAHVIDNCAYQTTFGVTEVVAEPPGQLTTTIRSGNGRGVRAKGSQIVVLGL